MKTILDFNVEHKKVILRCDFNVTIKDGKIISDERIKASLETINYLIEHHSKVIIMSHLGKIKTSKDQKDNSLFVVYQRLCELVKTKVLFSSATRGQILEDKIASLKDGEILLMENTRFEDLNEEAESKCNAYLSKYWASLGDLFINDAFGMTHRKHASNYGISKYLESGIGFLIIKEIKGLDLIINPARPFIIIMGGAKLDDKINLIKDLLPKCDYLLLGGGIANTFLSTKYNVGKSLISEDLKIEAKSLLNTYNNKIILPIDADVLNNEKVISKGINSLSDEDIIYDIGSKSISLFKSYIGKAKTIFINGTVGKYEDDHFQNGTKSILEAVASANAKRVIGGGDALSSADYFKIHNFDFISTGGGATLDYIASGKLKCIDE
jgi:phosphoglycerate kinase